jgi:hypothetical protein
MDADPTKSNEPDFNWDELIRELSDPACSKHAASFCRRYILGKLIAKHGLDIRSLGNRMDASDIASSVMGNFLRVSPVYADKPGDEVRKRSFAIKRPIRSEPIWLTNEMFEESHLLKTSFLKPESDHPVRAIHDVKLSRTINRK